MRIIESPRIVSSANELSVFLAGSIEMGKAIDWQTQVTEALKKSKTCDIVFNPRRADWDSSWIQDINNPQFKEQVTWELNHIEEKADIVFFYFDPNTISPISLMELGLATAICARVIVVCPIGFHRKGNVEILCERWSIPFFEDLDSGINKLINTLEKMKNV